MIIDNAKTIVKYRLWGLVISFIFLLILLTLLTPFFVQKEVFGISKYYYAIVIGAVYIGYNLYNILMNRYYFYYSDESDKLEFKFFSTMPFASKNNYIAIPKLIFEKFEITHDMFGLKPKLFLYQKSGRGGMAKYKPISLSALTQDEMSKLVISLKSYSAS